MLVIDASDSMNETDAAGVVKIDAARQGLTEFERQLPEGTPVGLRRFGDDNRYATLLSSTKDFDKKSFDLESKLLQVNSKSSESNLNYPVLIDERLHSLLFSIDIADAAPTKQQYEVFDDLQKEVQPLLAQYHELIAKDLAALNEMVNKESIPALYVPAGK